MRKCNNRPHRPAVTYRSRRAALSAVAVALCAAATPWVAAPGSAASATVYVASEDGYGDGGQRLSEGHVAWYQIDAGTLGAPAGTHAVARAVADGEGEDSRFGDIAATPDGRHLYVANGVIAPAPPQPTDDIYQYDVAGGGTLRAKDPPFVAAGEIDAGTGQRLGTYVTAIAASPDGGSVYAWTSAGSIAQYDVDVGTGRLIAKNPPLVDAGARGLPSVAVTPDGRDLYATGSYEGSTERYIWKYSVGSSGEITAMEVASTEHPARGGWPTAVAVTPDGRHLVVAHSGARGTPRQLHLYGIGGDGAIEGADADEDGLYEPLDIEPLGEGPEDVAVSPDGRNVYVIGGAAVAQFALDPTAADDLTPLDPATVPVPVPGGQSAPAATSVAVAADGLSVYVAERTTSTSGPEQAEVPAGWLAQLSRDPDSDGILGDILAMQRTPDGPLAIAELWPPDVSPVPAPEPRPAAVASLVAEACAATLRAPLASVSRWQAIKGRLRARLKVAPGGYVIRPDREARFVLQLRRAATRAGTGVRRVVFRLDGRYVGVDRRAPYTVAFAPGTLASGRHLLAADVRARGKRGRRLTLAFQASDCEVAAFSASMISKAPRRLADVELRARGGGPDLGKVSFGLSPVLRVATGGLERRRVGTIQLLGASGAVARAPLRVGRRTKAGIVLVARAKLRVRLKRRGRRSTLAIGAIEPLHATGVRVVLNGRRTGLLRNPSRCKNHRFSAALESTSGDKMTLERSLAMCKGRRR